MSGRRALPILGAAVGVAAAPTAAQAHLVATGMGPLYDGVAHFGLSPEDVLPVVALGLHAGLRGPRTSRLLLAELPCAWAAGGLLAMAGLTMSPLTAAAATAVVFLACGALLAFDAQAPRALSASLALAAGLVRGNADLAGAGAGLPVAGDLLGMCAAVFAVFALAASVSLPLARAWTRVATRVAGSWLAASGLLLAGWILRYGARAT